MNIYFWRIMVIIKKASTEELSMSTVHAAMSVRLVYFCPSKKKTKKKRHTVIKNGTL